MKKLLLFLLIVSASLFVAAQDNLYLIGNATPAGWDLSAAEPMQKVQDGWFIWYGELTNDGDAAEYKFLETNTDWLPSYNIDTSSSTNNKLYRRTDNSEPDDKIYVIDGQAGFYFVEAVTRADILENNRRKLDVIYPIGEGTPYNWDLGSSVSLTVDPTNPAIFSGTITLNTNGNANIKFLTTNDDWSAATIFPVSENNTDIAENVEMDFVTQSNKYGVADRQFIVKKAANYIITINFETQKIKFVDASTVGISEDIIDITNAKVSYFDLRGKSILNPTKGAFIKKTVGSNKTLTEKVILN